MDGPNINQSMQLPQYLDDMKDDQIKKESRARAIGQFDEGGYIPIKLPFNANLEEDKQVEDAKITAFKMTKTTSGEIVMG